MFVSLRGEPYVLWCAFDRHDIELDILLKKRRDKLAAKRFSKRVLSACAEAPKKIFTNRLGSYRAAKADMPKRTNVKYVCVKAEACLNTLNRHLLRASLYRKQPVARFEKPGAVSPASPKSGRRFLKDSRAWSSCSGGAVT